MTLYPVIMLAVATFAVVRVFVSGSFVTVVTTLSALVRAWLTRT